MARRTKTPSNMAHRTRAPSNIAYRPKTHSTLLLEQFKRQAYYSMHVKGRSIAEFTAMMNKLFKKIRDDTQIELQVE